MLFRSFHLAQRNYFTPTHFIVNTSSAEKLLNLPEIKDAGIFEFTKSGKLPAPLGMKMVVSPDQPQNHITILDAQYAAQKVTEQELLVESDKLIHQQWERTYLTVVTDFAILYDKARILIGNEWD